MGRVEDAMRRAAAEAGSPPATGESDTAVSVLAPEAFPVEAPAEDETPAVPEAPAAETGLELNATHDARTPRLMDVVHKRMTGKLVADRTMPPTSREQYRRLAATLHHAQVDHGLKVVMIASAVAGEGKTLTATNLALTFSESYRRSVLLIDADLRRPSLHTVFNIEPAPGLSDGLNAIENVGFTPHQISERLTVLPAGRPSSDPMAGLTSGRMRRLIAEAREHFDWVIIDTPPVGLMTDANLLAAMADGAILVVKAGSTSYQLAQRAVEAIGRDRLLGTVLNRADMESFGSHGYYYHYYYGGRDETRPTLAARWLGRFGRKHA
ncbi:MAG: polysaccharide biosynthesis tyrosine autokinase [Acidobacteria bacterium]|nr:polysaccharide biosynthesis tyrosine autokinase [Acidobacteriota bacterium]